MATEQQGTKSFSQVEDALGRALKITVETPIDLDKLPKGPNGKPLKYIDCILRPVAGVWGLIEDSVHQKNNVLSVTQTATDIIINFDFVAGKILSFCISPDETYQALNLIAGASVGVDKALIKISKQPVLYGAYISHNGSTWVVNGSSEITVASFTAGVLTLNHPFVDTTYLASVTRRELNYTPRLGGLGSTTSTISFYNDAGTLITTPDTSCKCYFMRGYPSQLNINPSDTTHIDQFGNLWVHGIFESA